MSLSSHWYAIHIHTHTSKLHVNSILIFITILFFDYFWHVCRVGDGIAQHCVVVAMRLSAGNFCVRYSRGRWIECESTKKAFLRVLCDVSMTRKPYSYVYTYIDIVHLAFVLLPTSQSEKRQSFYRYCNIIKCDFWAFALGFRVTLHSMWQWSSEANATTMPRQM